MMNVRCGHTNTRDCRAADRHAAAQRNHLPRGESKSPTDNRARLPQGRPAFKIRGDIRSLRVQPSGRRSHLLRPEMSSGHRRSIRES